MATWNVGPFDNDDAVNWCDRLERLSADQRVGELRRTLVEAVADPSRLSDPLASEAVAAAALVLRLQTGLLDERSPYSPRFPIDVVEGDDISDLRDVARQVLLVVMADGSAWRSRWAGDIEEDVAIDGITELYRTLGGQGSTPSHHDLGDDARVEVLRLCRAVRDARTILGLSWSSQAEILRLVDTAERSVTSPSLDSSETLSQMRAIRYILVEMADGPIAAILTDAVSRLLGDDIGRLFS